MAKALGEKVRCQVSSDNITWHSVGGENECTLTRNRGEAETTDKDSAGNKESLSAIRDWQISVNGLFEEGDNALAVLYTAYEATTEAASTIYVRAYDSVNSKYHTGQAHVTELTMGAALAEAVTLACTLIGTGALTRT